MNKSWLFDNTIIPHLTIRQPKFKKDKYLDAPSRKRSLKQAMHLQWQKKPIRCFLAKRSDPLYPNYTST
ncbi:MAG: hypothetical protein ACLUDU_01140 [Butyricimonas faecihominis]